MSRQISHTNELGQFVDRLTGLDEGEADDAAASLREEGFVCVVSVKSDDWTYEVGIYEEKT